MEITDYARLSPDLVLDAIESLGYLSDARVLALNSYENRVYHIGIEGETPIIAKFYRPKRWSDEQILEEHQFSLDLAAQEIPTVAPLLKDGRSLFEYQGYRFALYPRRGGHAPELEDLDTLYLIGQQLGRIHCLGRVKPFATRPTISIDSFGHESRDYILSHDFLSSSLREAYSSVSQHLLSKIAPMLAMDYKVLRLHGDCHAGNILTRDGQLFIVDLDDARNGPAIQDMWMLLSGDSAQRIAQMSAILDGYMEFCDFEFRELKLIEALRTLRMLHYSAWIARRWSDPAFPMAFPWFNTENYWARHILELREQMAILDEPPLRLPTYS